MKVRVWVHKSPIAGLGLFAAQDITKGTRILQYIGEKIPKDESTRRLAQGNVYIFTFNDRYDRPSPNTCTMSRRLEVHTPNTPEKPVPLVAPRLPGWVYSALK